MRTRTKLAVARMAYRVITAARKPLGLGHEIVACRGGINWKLDLREGIDLSIFLLGGFERATVAACQRRLRPGDIVLDIGANVGSYTLHFARAVSPSGRVLAFEPATFAFRKLQANISMNPELAPRITAEQIMLVDPGAELTPEIYASWPMTPAGDVHGQHGGRLMSTAGARATSLDEYIEASGVSSVGLVKLDVDGRECAVLRGATVTIGRFRPPIVMEIAPYVLSGAGHELHDLLELLESFGYGLRDPTSGASLPSDAQRLGALITDGASVNALAESR